jgi:hypothetical protein
MHFLDLTLLHIVIDPHAPVEVLGGGGGSDPLVKLTTKWKLAQFLDEKLITGSKNGILS